MLEAFYSPKNTYNLNHLLFTLTLSVHLRVWKICLKITTVLDVINGAQFEYYSVKPHYGFILSKQKKTGCLKNGMFLLAKMPS